MEKKSLFKINNSFYVAADNMIQAINLINSDDNIDIVVHSVMYIEAVCV